MNIKEVAEKLQISEHTIRNWEKEFNLEIQRDKSNYRSFSDGDIKYFEEIKNLRQEDNGIHTIQKKLGLFEPYNKSKSTDIVDNNANLISTLEMMQKNLITTLENKLDSILELSEKYSRATFEIGKLQALLEASNTEQERVKEQNNKDIITLLDGHNKDIIALNKDLEKQEMYLSVKEKENYDLREALEVEQNKSFWQRLFGS